MGGGRVLRTRKMMPIRKNGKETSETIFHEGQLLNLFSLEVNLCAMHTINNILQPSYGGLIFEKQHFEAVADRLWKKLCKIQNLGWFKALFSGNKMPVVGGYYSIDVMQDVIHNLTPYTMEYYRRKTLNDRDLLNVENLIVNSKTGTGGKHWSAL